MSDSTPTPKADSFMRLAHSGTQWVPLKDARALERECEEAKADALAGSSPDGRVAFAVELARVRAELAKCKQERDQFVELARVTRNSHQPFVSGFYKANEVLFPEPRKDDDGDMITEDVGLNLDSVITDLRWNKADPVCIETLERIAKQIELARAALSSAGEGG